MTIKRPMLSALAESREDLERHMPEVVLASPKLDGIRCLLHPEFGAVSRNFKPIPNKYIRTTLAPFQFLDGEIVTYTNGKMDDFNTIQSKVMSREGQPRFKFHAFDYFYNKDAPFAERYQELKEAILYRDGVPNIICLVEHVTIYELDTFLSYADTLLAKGWEGAMYRCPDGPYKEGRSTLRQGWLVKWKDIQDAEGVVEGFIERMHNDNTLTHDIFGMAERSSHKENMKPMGTLGALLLKTEWGTLRVGTGFDDSQRQEIWDNQEKYLGQTVTFKYQPHGMQNLPRFPVFKGFRYDGS